MSKVTQNRGFSPSLENTLLEKPHGCGEGGWGGVKLTSPRSLFSVNEYIHL